MTEKMVERHVLRQDSLLKKVIKGRMKGRKKPGRPREMLLHWMMKTEYTRGSAIAEEPRDALRQLKYYGRFLTELLTRSSANPEEPCEHTVS